MAVSYGGVYCMCSMVKLTFLISVFGIYLSIYIYIYILHTSKLICITMHLWIFLSIDNILTLEQSMVPGGSIGRVTWLELKSEKC